MALGLAALAAVGCDTSRAPLQLNLLVSPDQLDEVSALPRIEVRLSGPTGPGARFSFTGQDRVVTPAGFAFQTPLDVAVKGYDASERLLYAASASGLALTEGASLVVSLFFRRGGDFAQTQGPPMAVRRQHTATLLADGRVLVAGGLDAAGRALDSAELYWPSTGRFEALTAPLAQARAGHAAVLLGDGTVLLGGGEAGGRVLGSLERFWPEQRRFEAVGHFSTERRDLVAVRYGAGAGEKTLWLGGRDGTGPLATAEIVVSASLALAAPRAMAAPRAGHAVAEVPGGFLVVGGNGGRTAEQWLSADERFVALGAPMEAPRPRAAALTGVDGRVYLAGGTDALEVFDPASPAVIAVLDRLPEALSGVQLAPAGADVLLVGGSGLAGLTRTGRRFDGVRFAPTAGPLDVAREAPTVTPLGDGTVLVVGGCAERVAEVFAP